MTSNQGRKYLRQFYDYICNYIFKIPTTTGTIQKNPSVQKQELYILRFLSVFKSDRRSLYFLWNLNSNQCSCLFKGSLNSKSIYLYFGHIAKNGAKLLWKVQNPRFLSKFTITWNFLIVDGTNMLRSKILLQEAEIVISQQKFNFLPFFPKCCQENIGKMVQKS